MNVDEGELDHMILEIKNIGFTYQMIESRWNNWAQRIVAVNGHKRVELTFIIQYINII